MKDPCQAWPSSWVAGLETRVSKLHDGRKGRSDQLTLVNVGEDTTLGDGDVTEQLVQLLVVADGELKMTGNDTRLLVVTGRVTSQLQDFGCEVLQDGGEVDGSTGTDTLSVVALAEQTVDTTDRESETGLGRTPWNRVSIKPWKEIPTELQCRKRIKTRPSKKETRSENPPKQNNSLKGKQASGAR